MRTVFFMFLGIFLLGGTVNAECDAGQKASLAGAGYKSLQIEEMCKNNRSSSTASSAPSYSQQPQGQLSRKCGTNGYWCTLGPQFQSIPVGSACYCIDPLTGQPVPGQMIP